MVSLAMFTIVPVIPNLPNHLPIHIRQPIIPPRVAEGEPFVVEAEEVEDDPMHLSFQNISDVFAFGTCLCHMG